MESSGLAPRASSRSTTEIIRLVTTFFAQGLIAIQNVQLFRELEQRSGELARSVDELRALGEVSQAVSLSLDLDEVVNTIVTRAVELSGTDSSSVFEYEPSTAEFVLRTCSGTVAELDGRASPPHDGSGMSDDPHRARGHRR